MSDRPRNHGYAAFEPADVDDAKRGRPDFDLRAYAEERSLEFLDRADPPLAGWKQALPRFPEYAFNMVRGELPGGAYGLMWHEAWEIAASGEGETKHFEVPGEYYSVHYKGVGSATWLNLIPFIGWMFSKDRSHVLEEPFGLNRIWVPTTVVTLRVSEPIGVAPHFAFLQRAHTGRGVGKELSGFGLPDTRLVADSELPDDLLAPFMADPHRFVHLGWVGGYFAIRFQCGTMMLRRNGFLREPEMLDKLAGDASAVARQFAEACLPRAEPRPFQESLPERTIVETIDLTAPPDPFAIPPGEWVKGFKEYAQRHGLVHEEPRAFHRAFPRLPSPGQAVAVMRGPRHRVVYYAEHPLAEKQNVRGAIVFRTSHADTPPEGVRDADSGFVLEVRDGVAVIWSIQSWGWKWAYEDDFPQRAAAVADSRGLYA
ncbi:MAG TPA: hypothetical protein VD790_12530 [Thermoleophilaceae bacterium]|nr:hypothetical protein [Thermoleophilaceae bacterium]